MTLLYDNRWINHQDSPGIAFSVDVGIKNESSLRVVKRIDGIWKMYELDTMAYHNYELLSTECYKKDEPTFLCLFAEVNLKISDYVKTFHFDEDRKIVNKDECVMSGFLILPHPTHYRNSPIIVISHGGPLYMFNHEYSRLYHMLHLNKFCLYLLNYRGSTGYTNSTLQSINGNNGRQDVDDVHLTLLEVCQFEKLSTETVYCGGGSYGGFLSTHLVSQYPDFYKGCFLRNPLTNFLGEFYKKSPLYYADQIKCPVTLFLGSEDKRVPMEQGLQIYQNMMSRNQDVTVFIYNDGHALQSVEASTSMMCEILKFISRISPPKALNLY
ncbi:Acylamino-acid-releasing enzyme [Thelohanellus kitauei]|uniref:Acylamino-acid-releasing enzyme n=1 Tax=Thelohanellus kitauei TaxID=669202 RepID=A0A0C2J1X5_THEKT|nr:Acylamino-acid-releasing enzyme [Thelohanellus kitauei]